MNPAQVEGMRLVARVLRYCGPSPAAELVTRLMGSRSEEDAWDVIEVAENIGMIEPAEMIVEPRSRIEEWRLVEGFDAGRVEMPA